uniref:Ribonuclease VapC n=1 Tax=Agrobacterium albertimagni TaxID=147266 RepID=A0A7C1P0P9_9HYPH
MFSLDSSTTIDFLRKPSRDLVNRIAVARDEGLIAISSIVLFELSYGAERQVHPTHMERLQLFLEGDVMVLEFDAEDALAAGRLRADLERGGFGIGPFDTLIAAQALRRGFTLVTANIREFDRVKGLKVENWRT